MPDDTGGDLSKTTFVTQSQDAELQEARQAVRELRDQIKPYLNRIEREDTWSTYATQAAELILRLHKVGLDLKVWRSERGQIIFCLCGFPHKNLMAWADQRNVDILIDADRAIQEGAREDVRFPLALATATREEEELVQARIADESKRVFIDSKIYRRIGKREDRNRFKVTVSDAKADEDDLDIPKSDQKLSRTLWDNIYCNI